MTFSPLPTTASFSLSQCQVSYFCSHVHIFFPDYFFCSPGSNNALPLLGPTSHWTSQLFTTTLSFMFLFLSLHDLKFIVLYYYFLAPITFCPLDVCTYSAKLSQRKMHSNADKTRFKIITINFEWYQMTTKDCYNVVLLYPFSHSPESLFHSFTLFKPPIFSLLSYSHVIVPHVPH